MAAHWEPAHTRARHQSLHHFVSQAAWSDDEILKRVAQWVVLAMDFSIGGWWMTQVSPSRGGTLWGWRVPQEVRFATKPMIALEQIKRLMDEGAPRHCVLADAGYGVDTAFRDGILQSRFNHFTQDRSINLP